MKKLICALLAMIMIFSMIFFAMAKEEENVVQLHSCDGPMGRFDVDRNEKVEGAASLSHTFRSGTKDFANQVSFAPIDAKGTDTLAMEIYVSDPSMFQHFTQLCVEITSAGTCDQKENAWMIHTTLIAQRLKEGWNTVYLYLDDSATTNGQCDLSAINYLRIFGFFDGDKLNGQVMKIDDIRMIYTGGPTYNFEKLTYYKGDNAMVDIQINGQDAPDLSKRHEGMTVKEGVEQ